MCIRDRAKAKQGPDSADGASGLYKAVRVVNPGLFTTVQDLGRKGWQRFGVPVAGVFDTLAARVANWLVGNLSLIHIYANRKQYWRR